MSVKKYPTNISQCPAFMMGLGQRSVSTTQYKIIIFDITKSKFNMQRCQSGRSCSLGTAVYRNVPRVQIPISAPKNSPFYGTFFICWDWACALHTIAFSNYLNLYSSLILSASALAPKYIRFRSYRQIPISAPIKTALNPLFFICLSGI